MADEDKSLDSVFNEKAFEVYEFYLRRAFARDGFIGIAEFNEQFVAAAREYGWGSSADSATIAARMTSGLFRELE
ncbi:hypothetical protein AB4Y36_22125 [Paraburkholderia sp. BR10936]|uniref:hypothetical protein n=1 Tax=Paraburkholderia sp. BR10936 TaxID=3236993 RepID=UPI0034D1C984